MTVVSPAHQALTPLPTEQAEEPPTNIEATLPVPGQPETTRRRSEDIYRRRSRNYSVMVAAVGLVLYLVIGVLTFSTHGDFERADHGLVLFLFTAVAFVPGVRLRRGHGYHFHKFWEFPLIVALSSVPVPDAAFAGCTIALVVLVAIAVIRPEKNMGRLPSAAGSIVIAIVLGTLLASTEAPWTYPAGLAVMVAIHEGLWFGYEWSRGRVEYAKWAIPGHLWRRLSISVSVSCVVTLLVHFAGTGNEMLLLSPIALLVIFWVCQVRVEAMDEQAAWRHMESVSSKFIGELEEHKAIAIALEESLKLFAASRAEVLLPPTDTTPGARYSLRLGDGEVIEVDMVTCPAAVPGQPMSRYCQTIPLAVGETDLGYLTLEWDCRSRDRKARRSLTNTFGHAVAASIGNTRHTQRISRQAAQKAREAERDPLTGLGNRAMLADRGALLLAESAEIGRPSALLLFDLDGFKRINDTLGHAAGDEVIVEVARRIKSSVRKGDLAIRLGGDEFAILATDLNTPDDAQVVAEKIAAALAVPMDIQELLITVETSVGVAIYPSDADTVPALLKRADIAMYQAKSMGKGQTFRYDPASDHNTTESLRLATDLRAAIASEDQLVLHYQPQVDVSTNEILGVEALVRWQHPTDGMLYPDSFIPLIERSNMVRPFTVAILEKALADRRTMRAALPHGTVSVNLSAQNLLDSCLPLQVAELLTRYEIAPEELILEVTETSTAKDVIAAERVLNELCAMGCQIAMDDFGSGYATMESLRSGSPITEIKIDRAFIKDITTVERDRAVAQAIVDIAHAWDCRVVAEGVEDERTYMMLRDMGCDSAQGYWLSRPAPLDKILTWVADRTGRNTPLSLRLSAPQKPTSKAVRPTSQAPASTPAPRSEEETAALKDRCAMKRQSVVEAFVAAANRDSKHSRRVAETV